MIIHAARKLADATGRLADKASTIIVALLLMLAVVIPAVAFGAEGTAQAASAPTPMTAWYMYGTTASGLDSTAYEDGYTTAGEVPADDLEYLLLDFGEPLYFGSNTYGAYDYSDTSFTNPQILTALENAANGVHDGYRTGIMTIVYGNSNYGNVGGLTSAEAYDVGEYQVLRASQLAAYQVDQGYVDQGAAAGSDMEPDWATPAMTEQLVNGATAEGGYLYIDYGSADGCPTTGDSGYCNNGWDVVDEIYVSWHGEAVPFPEIYSETLADQWNVIRTRAQADGDDYKFWGITGSAPSSTAEAEWDDLYDLDSGVLSNDIACFGC